MGFLRTLNAALARLAYRMQGQDVERPPVVKNHCGADYAALNRAHTSQGLGPIGLAR